MRPNERCIFCKATAEERDLEKTMALNDPHLQVEEGSQGYAFLAGPHGTCFEVGASGLARCVYLSDGAWDGVDDAS